MSGFCPGVFGGACSDGDGGLGGGAIDSVPTARMAWVSIDGDDGSGVAGDASKPFATHVAALAAIVALVPSPDLANPGAVTAYPGTYAESAISIPAGVAVLSVTGREHTFINTSVLTGAAVTMAGDSRFQGYTVSGASGAGGIGVLTSGPGTANLASITVDNCETGVKVSGASTVFVGHSVMCQSGAGSMTTGFVSELGANTNIIEGSVVIVSGAGYLCDAASLRVVTMSGIGCAFGAQVSGGGFLSCTTGEFIFCAIGISVVDASTAALSGMEIASGVGPAPLSLLATGLNGTVRLSSCLIDNQLIVLDSTTEVRGNYVAITPGLEGTQFEGDLSVGVPGRPGRMSVGSGHAGTIGMTVLANTNLDVGAWTDLTSNLATIGSPPATLFSAVSAGASTYVGADLPVAGHAIDVTSIAALGAGNLTVEYWNGATWAPVNYMASNGSLPYQSRATQILLNLNLERHHFDDLSSSVALSLNGVTKHWVRYRVVGGITTSPIANHVLQIHDSALFSEKGTLLLFGLATAPRQIQLVTHPLVGPAAPSAEDISYADTIVLSEPESSYSGNGLNGKGGTFELPVWADTSREIHVSIPWKPATAGAGNVEFRVDFSVANPGDLLDGSIVAQQILTVVPTPGAADLSVNTDVHFRVPDALPGSRISLSVRRDGQAANPADTYAGAIHVGDLVMEICAWR